MVENGEQGGYILLHLDLPPASLGRIEFVVIVAHQQGQILYGQLREDRSWTLPTGRVEYGETPEQAVHRELRNKALSRLIGVSKTSTFSNNPRKCNQQS